MSQGSTPSSTTGKKKKVEIVDYGLQSSQQHSTRDYISQYTSQIVPHSVDYDRYHTSFKRKAQPAQSRPPPVDVASESSSEESGSDEGEPVPPTGAPQEMQEAAPGTLRPAQSSPPAYHDVMSVEEQPAPSTHRHHHRHHHGDVESQHHTRHERIERLRQQALSGQKSPQRRRDQPAASERRKDLVKSTKPETKKERKRREKEEKKRAKMYADMKALQEFEESHNYYPLFIKLVTFLDMILFGYTVYKNGGFAPWNENPFYGPSTETLMDMGAKYGPKILEGEWWRLFTAIFLHVGVIHMGMNMSFQLKAGMQLEKDYGWHRIGIIYILSGVAGNLASSIFLPKQVQVGASGALYGLLGVLFSDLIQNWHFLQSPCSNLCSMLVTTAISLGMGLLPFVDNFAHVGGFICGVLAGIVFLPTIHFGFLNRTLKFFAVPLLLAYFGALISVFYTRRKGDEWCPMCLKANCLDMYFNCTVAEYEEPQ